MSAQHIHIIDGKQVNFPNDSCPICRPETQQPQQATFVPNVHRKGDTIVMQASRGVMSTTTWWVKGGVFLHSVRKIARDQSNKVLMGSDNQPIWSQQTMRMNIALAKEYVAELSKIISEVDKPQPAPQQTAPQRA